MNRVDFTLTGGRPIKEDTYGHMQNGFIEAISNMLKETGTTAPDGVKLFGCDVTITGGGNTGEVTAGAVYIAGEIYTVDAASGITKTGSDTFVFKIMETTASPTLTYFDATSQNPHLVRKATLSYEPNATAGNFMPYNADNWRERVYGTWESQTTSAADFAADGGGSWSVTASSIHSFYNKFTKSLEYKANIGISSVATSAAPFLRLRLPLGPDGGRLNTTLSHIGIGLHGTDMLLIDDDATSGWIKLTKADGTNFSVGSLDPIRINFVTFAVET